MDQVRWQQIKRLYYARWRARAEARTAFLEEACAGDASLRREVESLLESPANAPRLDSVNGHPMGEPFLVHHFHAASRRWGSTGFGNATVTGCSWRSCTRPAATSVSPLSDRTERLDPGNMNRELEAGA